MYIYIYINTPYDWLYLEAGDTIHLHYITYATVEPYESSREYDPTIVEQYLHSGSTQLGIWILSWQLLAI